MARSSVSAPQGAEHNRWWPLRLVILGEPCSKANRRQLVTIRGRPALIKSKEALSFEESALWQIPREARLMLDVELRMFLWLFYSSQRPDMDESIVLDVLQARFKAIGGSSPGRVLLRRGVYLNDRLVRERHVYHAIDRFQPRAEVLLEPRSRPFTLHEAPLRPAPAKP